MSLVKHEPFRELTEFRRRMNQLFESFFESETKRLTKEPFAPSCDVEENPEALVVKMDIPGIDEKDISVRVSGDYLIVKGAREIDKDVKEKHFHHTERFYGMFERIIPLHVAVDTDNIKAEYHKGVLEIYLPRKEAAKHKEIPVQVK